MKKQGLDIPPPTRKRTQHRCQRLADIQQPQSSDEKIQFNKRISRSTAERYEILAIRSHKRIPDLLLEGLELLEQRYDKN